MPLFDLTTVVGRQACAAFFTLPPVTPSLCWPIAYGIEKQLVTMDLLPQASEEKSS
eukprot:m.1084860 g.1084860  ORF g.1084860 m.1084860 type:complete len:56 (-) comp24275_c0_seq9:210-377(-)